MTGKRPDPDPAALFSGWEVKQRADGLLHAWLIGTDPPLIVTGKDEASLRDQIKAAALRTQL